jgi:hypothetical protein
MTTSAVTPATRDFIERINALTEARHLETDAADQDVTIHVDGLGKTIMKGYEKVRNAAEYTEVHTLLQRAIVRFCSRRFPLTPMPRVPQLADELIIELTLSGYIPNDSVTEAKRDRIRSRIQEFWTFYQATNLRISERRAYCIEPLAARIEDILTPYAKGPTVVQYAYEYYSHLYRADIRATANPRHTHLALFIATARAIIKPTNGWLRSHLLQRYKIRITETQDWLAMNRELDTVLRDRQTNLVIRRISNLSAPFRILRRQVEKDASIDFIARDSKTFAQRITPTINEAYRDTQHAISSGVIKSIIFLLITKTIIGVSIEVPYDLLVHHYIFWLPLAVNLIFPPLYMFLLSLTLTAPSSHNTRLLVRKLEEILYEKKEIILNKTQSDDHLFARAKHGKVFNFFYWVFFIAIIFGVSYTLTRLHFNLASFGIFFVFLSTASFLCFRLARLIREVEVKDENNQSFGASLRDLLYLPFVILGQWITDKYSKINFVSRLLDLIVELPLKDVIRAIRTWNIFISSKKDEL